jgi:hypothetical protein
MKGGPGTAIGSALGTSDEAARQRYGQHPHLASDHTDKAYSGS